MPRLFSRTAKVAILTKHQSRIVSKLNKKTSFVGTEILDGPIIHYLMAALVCSCALLGRLPDGEAEANLVDKVCKVVDAVQ